MTDKKKRKMTPEQARAVESKKGNVIISASAGSGKTTTMVSRVAELIKERGAKTSEIAMMTFTEASAREMTSRLSDLLLQEIKNARERSREASDLSEKEKADREFESLVCALDELPFLSCGTIHAFCLGLIKRHFELVNLSPSLSVMDEDSAVFYKKQAMNSLIKKRYAEDKDRYLSFSRLFGEKGDDLLSDSVFALYDLMTTCEEREGFLDRAKETANLALGASPYASYYLSYLSRRIFALREVIRPVFEKALAFEARSYSEKLRFYETILDEFSAVSSLRDVFLSAERAAAWAKPRLSSKEGKLFPEFKEECECVFELCERFLKEMKGLLSDYGSYAQAEEDYKNSAAATSELIDLTREFSEEYEKVKEKEKLLDYADFEKYAVELLSRPEIRGELGFKYVLVDECQDVNPVQDRIVRYLAEGNELFTVGDVKQSIYRFRLADPEIFNDRLKRGEADPEASDVILFDKNFRSSPCVIDFVNTVFSSLMTESFGGVDYKKHLLAGREPAATEEKEGEIGLFFFEEPQEENPEIAGVYSVRTAVLEEEEAEEKSTEGEWVLSKLREVVGSKLYDAKKKAAFTVSYRDVAILAAKRNAASSVVRYLQKAGIPLNVGNFLKDENGLEEEQLVDFLRLILSPSDDYALLSVLRSPMFEASNETLLRIGKEEGKNFYEKALSYSGKPEGTLVRSLFSYLEQARFMSSILPLYELASSIAEEKFRLPLLKEKDGRLRFGKLLSFVESLKGKWENAGIAEYLTFYDEFYSGKNGGEIEEKDAVSVMTIHASKGLEFPVVFLVGTAADVNPVEDHNRQIAADRELGVAKKITDEANFEKRKNFAVEAIAKKKREEGREDSLRLLYVALTRAKNSLYVSGKLSEKSYRDRPSPAFASSMAEWIAYAIKGKYPIERYFERKASFVPEKVLPVIPESSENAALLRDAFRYEYPYQKATETGIKYTVTGINNTEEEGYAPPIPLFPEDQASKGTRFHAVMENVPLSVSSEEEMEKALEHMRELGVLSESEKDEIDVAVALDAVRKIRDLTDGFSVEREKSFMLRSPAEEIGLSGVKDYVAIQGKIDLIARKGNQALIVDYKLTSAPAYILKERYRAQLDLYELAVQKAYGSADVEKYIFVLGRNELIRL